MRCRSLFAAVALATAACDDLRDPIAPGAERPRLSAGLLTAPLGVTSYTSTWSHTVLPLLPNVQANQAQYYGTGINEDGHIAGYVEGPFDGAWFTTARATLWTPAGVQDLGVLPPGSPSQRSYATDINDGGLVTGWGTTRSSTGVCCGVVRGFRWSSTDGMQPLAPPVASDQAITRGYAINVMGHVAGMVTDAAGDSHAALWTDPASPAQIIAAAGPGSLAWGLNDVGQVVGANASGAFVWSAADGLTTIPTLGSSWMTAVAINNLGTVVGHGETADGSLHPFRWTAAGGTEDLHLPPGATNAYGRAVTKSGRIAVTAEFHDAGTGEVTSRLFLWADGQWIDLGPEGFGSTYAGGINEKLQLAGSGLPPGSSGLAAMRWDVTLTPAAPGYTFAGFFAPIQNLPVVNRVKAGQGIPVKFSLGGDQGLAIFAPGFPVSQPVACDNDAPVDPVDETVTAGGSTLTYDAASAQYTYIWKTDRTWAATCRLLTVRLSDGSEHRALFQFTR